MQPVFAAKAWFADASKRAGLTPYGPAGSATAATSSIRINSKTERNMTRQTAGEAKKFKVQTINVA